MNSHDNKPEDKRKVVLRVEIEGGTKVIYSTKDMGFKKGKEILVIHKGHKTKVSEFDSRFDDLVKYLDDIATNLSDLKSWQK